MSYIAEKNIKATGYGKCNNISVELGYSLGGHNYWNGNNEARGYYLYARPEERSGGMTGFVIGDGFKLCLKQVNRQSKKAEAEALKLFEEKADWAVQYICNQYSMELTEE